MLPGHRKQNGRSLLRDLPLSTPRHLPTTDLLSTYLTIYASLPLSLSLLPTLPKSVNSRLNFALFGLEHRNARPSSLVRDKGTFFFLFSARGGTHSHKSRIAFVFQRLIVRVVAEEIISETFLFAVRGRSGSLMIFE